MQVLVTREYTYFLPSRKYISLSWCDNNYEEKLETMVKQNVGGKTMSIMVFFKYDLCPYTVVSNSLMKTKPMFLPF